MRIREARLTGDPGFDTLALHAGAPPDPATGARALPIHLITVSTTRAPVADTSGALLREPLAPRDPFGQFIRERRGVGIGQKPHHPLRPRRAIESEDLSAFRGRDQEPRAILEERALLFGQREQIDRGRLVRLDFGGGERSWRDRNEERDGEQQGGGPLDGVAVHAAPFLFTHLPPHPDVGAGHVHLTNRRGDLLGIRHTLEHQVNGAPRRRLDQLESGRRRLDLPQQKALGIDLAVVEAADRGDAGGVPGAAGSELLIGCASPADIDFGGTT